MGAYDRFCGSARQHLKLVDLILGQLPALVGKCMHVKYLPHEVKLFETYNGSQTLYFLLDLVMQQSSYISAALHGPCGDPSKHYIARCRNWRSGVNSMPLTTRRDFSART